MKSRKPLWLILIFMVVLAVRLYYAFQTDEFSSDNSYFVLRQVENIRETGIPLYNDPLSYGGRTYIFSPLYYYALAFFDLFLPLVFVCKLIPNIFASLLVVVIYLIAFEITKSRSASLFAAFISGFIPVFVKDTVNSISVNSLIVPLIFLMVYFFIRMGEEPKYISYFIFCAFLMPLVSPLFLLFVISLVFFIILAKIEDVKLIRAEVELTLFSLFLTLWILFVVFKNAFLFHGPLLVWQNIPQYLLSNHFRDFSILEAIYKIGIIPFVYGIITMYSSIFIDKKRQVYILISLVIPFIALLWLKMISLDIGYIFLGASFAAIYSQHFRSYSQFLDKTKFSRFKMVFIGILVMTFILTSVIPSMHYAKEEVMNVPFADDIAALRWLKDNSAESSVVLAPLDQGHLVTYFSGRKNVVDLNFLLVTDPNQRLKDIDQLYTTRYTTDAVNLVNKYGIGYILLSRKAQEIYSIDELYYSNSKCFDRVLNGKVRVYQSLCVIEEKNAQ